MKITHLIKFGIFGISTILFRRKQPILGTIIITDKCNLECKHCAVHDITGVMHPYNQIKNEMDILYKKGVRILFFSGGETFLWNDNGKTLRDLVIEAKEMGFYIVNIVTNGTFGLDLPEANLILLSLDGDKERHNTIRGDTYDCIMNNIDNATANNICIYMAINQINKDYIRQVCDEAKNRRMIKAVSFNFHTPYPGTTDLTLSVEDKQKCCNEIEKLIDEGYPIFNLKSAFPYIIHNTFPAPCHQCLVIENGKISTCGRCIGIRDLCKKCGYFFAAEYTLVFSGKIRVLIEMLRTYLKYV